MATIPIHTVYNSLSMYIQESLQLVYNVMKHSVFQCTCISACRIMLTTVSTIHTGNLYKYLINLPVIYIIPVKLV